MDTQVAFTYRLQPIMLQETWGYTYHFELAFSFSLNKYSEVGLLDHMVVLVSISLGNFVFFF